MSDTHHGNTLRYSSFRLPIAQKKKELLEEIICLKADKKKIDNEINSIKDKIEFITENQCEKFDEEEFKAFQTLKLVDNPKLSRIEKAKLIAKLLK